MTACDACEEARKSPIYGHMVRAALAPQEPADNSMVVPK
jgi:hypothetical protein